MNKNIKAKLIKLYEEGCKQIDDNPFISHKLTFFWRLAGAKMSQADMLKEQLRYTIFEDKESV